MRFFRKPDVELELIGLGEREAGIISVAVNVVRLHGIEAFRLALVEPGAQNRCQAVDLPDVEPLLACPASVIVANEVGRELISVWPPIFPTADADVADDSATLGV